MIWACYMRLGENMWFKKQDRILLEDDVWEKVKDEAEKSGINMIVLDLGEGVHYATHPELSAPNAWTRERVRDEVKELKERGIALIPKLNFSATHHLWLGEYRKMMSTKLYYDVCRDLIYEVYDLFDKPEYIHIGMDEEGVGLFFKDMELVSYRQGELLWHDFQFLCDCVRDKGATPWIWGDLQKLKTEEFEKRVRKDNIIVSPWYYFGIKKEHFTPLSERRKWKPELNEEPYKSMYEGLTYQEELDYTFKSVRKGIKAANDGYNVIPTVSVWGRNKYNSEDTLDHYKLNAPKESVLGFMTAPWNPVDSEHIETFMESFKTLREAREKIYPETL